MKTRPKVPSLSAPRLRVTCNTSSFVSLRPFQYMLSKLTHQVHSLLSLGIKSWEIWHFKENLVFIIRTLGAKTGGNGWLFCQEEVLDLDWVSGTHRPHPSLLTPVFPFIVLLQLQLLDSTSLPLLVFELHNVLGIVRYKDSESTYFKISGGDWTVFLLSHEVLLGPEHHTWDRSKIRGL